MEAVDLICRLLCLFPEKRFTASQSLSHAYVRQFYTQRDVRWVGEIHSMAGRIYFTTVRSSAVCLRAHFHSQEDTVSKKLLFFECSVTKENVVPPLSDDIQLSVPEYKEKLYELIQQYKSSSKKGQQTIKK